MKTERTFLRHRAAFTLIELLVVIAIIALLAAILFPVFGRARSNARRASCQSNLRQMGLAMVQYTQDYDEFYPWAIANLGTNQPDGKQWLPENGPTYWAWPQILYPYHKSKQVFVCPESPNGSTAETPVRGHYGVNRDIVPFVSAGPPSKTSQFAATSKTYLMFDSSYYMLLASNVKSPSTNSSGLPYYLPGSGPYTTFTESGGPLPANLEADYQSGRHFEGVNVAFADGHVKWVRSEVMVAEAKKTASTGGLYGAWNPANG